MSREDVYSAVEAMVRRWDGLRIVGTRNFRCGDAQVPGQARRWVVDVLCVHDVPGELLETVELLVSEVVTNSFLYSDSGSDPDGLITVGVGIGRGMIYIEVIDPGSLVNVPAMRPAEDEDLGGRGLAWVNQLSDGWGTDYDPEIGRALWFHLAWNHAPH
ncbi:ATP-binding protein [Streptosporangium longisporum]|uniref:Histidine kinase/HSP90-like ATPase domain-containing protein n=1 Tax=Streptosporangium longisporum TaxID=46187 RepID=A0ABN3YBJ6_9ACTN